jgi:CubicO group peptidase (beta-lactamase class C family)
VPDLDAAARLVAERGCPAQLCVLSGGEVVLDRCFGCAPDALFFLFSASKPMVALLVHQLAERGLIGLDDPVARYWPEFGQRGKAAITIRQVLQHRSGLPVARSAARDALAMTDWAASVRALERATPAFPPGTVPAYHFLSYGFLLGEVVQRVTGAPVRDVLQDRLLAPLRLRDSFLGLTPDMRERRVRVRGRGGTELLTGLMINRRAVRQAVIPAAGVSSTARDLARLYAALARGGELDGVRVLSAATLQSALRPSSDGETDRFLKLPVRWSEGFQLGGARAGPERLGGRHSPLGQLSSRNAFGHNGSYVCIGWADPDRDLAVGYVTSRLASRADGARHMAEVSDAVLAACA